VCHIYVITGTHILAKAVWNLVFTSCCRLGVKVNSARCTAQNSKTTTKVGACSTVLILVQPNELAQVMTALNSLQRFLFSEFLLSHWLIILQRNVSVRELAYAVYDQTGIAACPRPNTRCILYAVYTAHQLSLQSLVVTICTTSLTFNNPTFCPHNVYLCVLCGSENKQRLFPCTTLTDWFV
jgi:hypothetical protein